MFKPPSDLYVQVVEVDASYVMMKSREGDAWYCFNLTSGEISNAKYTLELNDSDKPRIDLVEVLRKFSREKYDV